MDIDTEDHRMKIKPCDHTHVDYCYRVALEVLSRKVRELSEPWKKDIEAMKDLLKWQDSGVFMRQSFDYADNGLTAYQVFWDYESKGVSLPEECEEPVLLSDLIQAKRNKEFTITEWLDAYWGIYGDKYKRDEYPIWPEEYLSHPAMDDKLFEKLFLRKPNRDILMVIQ
jgi:hypothetical protein